MRRIRVIPVLLIHNGGLVKSVRFKQYTYVGDPINAVKIFNEKEVDEIIILDIDATKNQKAPDFDKIKEIASEAFIPLAYGGGIKTIDEIRQLFYLGVEKIILNNQAYRRPSLITEAASIVGSQSVVASVDIKKNWTGRYKVFVNSGTQSTGMDPIEYIKTLVDAGAGEIFINNIDRDGTFSGYDIGVISNICKSVEVPVIVCGGASGMDDFNAAVQAGASAVAAGSLFVFQRPHRAVLISYPTARELEEELFSKFN